jgi:3'-phosphoadenosine 5'-phosphosulfate sulfotransferase (PAPS reductase)/FAD synthetase
MIQTAVINIPDLRSYDAIVVQYSAGKDSQAMLDVVIQFADLAGVPRDRIVVFHADLGRVEWAGTAELAAEHAEHYGLRFEMKARPQGDLLTHIEQRGMFPSAKARYCTSDHKRGQGRTFFTRLVRELALDRPARILTCMGLRAEESPARAKKVPMRHDTAASNGKRHIDEWLPILDWTVDEVWTRIRRAGTRPHWAYAAGMPRLSCSFCVLASKSALVRAAQLRPELATEYARVEAKIGHRFRNDLSMSEIITAARTEPCAVAANWTA